MSTAPQIYIFCDGNEKIGFGHIRRSQALASQLLHDGSSVQIMRNAYQPNVLLSLMTAKDSMPKIIIFDTPLDIDEKLNFLAKQGQLTIALDYFGNALPDVNIAVFEHQPVLAKRAAYVGFEYIMIRDEISTLGGGVYKDRSGRVMVMVGGGDALCQAHLAAKTLVQTGCKVNLIQGPYALNLPRCADYEVHTNPSNLPELFAGCDWAVTNGGGSLFEGLYLSKAVHVLPQTMAEDRIARHFDSLGCLLGVGLESLRAYSKNEVNNIASKAGHLVDGLGVQRVSKIVRSWL